MKRVINIIITISFIIMVLGCDIPIFSINLSNTFTNPSHTPTLTAKKYFWGYWTRMDTGDVYLITDNSVKIEALSKRRSEDPLLFSIGSGGIFL